MPKLCYTFALCLLLSVCAFAQQASSPADVFPAVIATVSSASYEDYALAGGSLVSTFGSGLSSSAALDSAVIRIKDASGTEHTVSRIFFVSSSQINYQLPDGLASGLATSTITDVATGRSISGTLNISNVAPGIFTANSDGRGVPAASLVRVKADGSQSYEEVGQFNSDIGKFVPLPIDNSIAEDQLYLVLYGTGWRGRIAEENATAYVGNLKGEIKYLGRQGRFIGMDQANILLPKLLTKGNYSIKLIVDGKAANEVVISIK